MVPTNKLKIMKTNFIVKIFARPTTTGGNNTMIITAIMAVIALIVDNSYPELMETELLASLETILGILFMIGASREQKPVVIQETQRGITENPPIKR